MSSAKAKKKKKRGFIFFVLFLIILGLLGGAGYYGYKNYVVNNTFLPESTLNGVDVSGMTRQQAEKALIKEWNENKVLSITEQGTPTGKITHFDLDYKLGDQVELSLHPGLIPSILRIWDKEIRSADIVMTPKGSSESFDKQFAALDIVKEGKGTVETKDAYVDLSNRDFDIVPEVQGDNLDQDALKDAMLESIANNEMTFHYVASNFYAKPKVTSDSEEIRRQKSYADTYLSTEITYNTPTGEYTIDPETLNKMIAVDDTGTITPKKKAVKKFVEEELYYQCNTIGITRDLKLAGGHVTVTGGDYGFSLDTEGETKQLQKDLATGENITRDPVYGRKGWGDPQGDDVGDTYVEVDISRQHVWCVQKGKTVLSSDVVTGNVNDNAGTPTGTFAIMYKESPSVLKGENSDGSTYETPVTWWMPFFAGCGFHDASWRSAFGGTIYQGGGSHGCVNMPPANAKKLYGYVEAGMPVIVHD